MARATRAKYTVILQAESDPDFRGYFNVIVPALPGCLTYGASRDEALANAKEAVEVYLEDLAAAGEPLPEERIETVGIEV
jgi:predicted RNase H-like HicB family nuclease